MSQPSAGNYYIVNRETTSDGTSLAINFNGESAVLTVTELGSQPTQVWVISGDGDLQAVAPQDATGLRVDFGESDSLTTVNHNGPAWAIRGDDDIYTIQNGEYTVFWGLDDAAAGQAVFCSPGPASVLQNWKLIPA